mmetsp:Transcript_4391/g.6939  ORF Transcript_4391/g.6939 Transcript_4391/m.6939 type:complete len:487 (-) Transcript_4391:120-1580(-)
MDSTPTPAGKRGLNSSSCSSASPFSSPAFRDNNSIGKVLESSLRFCLFLADTPEVDSAGTLTQRFAHSGFKVSAKEIDHPREVTHFFSTGQTSTASMLMRCKRQKTGHGLPGVSSVPVTKIAFLRLEAAHKFSDVDEAIKNFQRWCCTLYPAKPQQFFDPRSRRRMPLLVIFASGICKTKPPAMFWRLKKDHPAQFFQLRASNVLLREERLSSTPRHCWTTEETLESCKDVQEAKQANPVPPMQSRARSGPDGRTVIQESHAKDPMKKQLFEVVLFDRRKGIAHPNTWQFQGKDVLGSLGHCSSLAFRPDKPARLCSAALEPVVDFKEFLSVADVWCRNMRSGGAIGNDDVTSLTYAHLNAFKKNVQVDTQNFFQSVSFENTARKELIRNRQDLKMIRDSFSPLWGTMETFERVSFHSETDRQLCLGPKQLTDVGTNTVLSYVSENVGTFDLSSFPRSGTTLEYLQKNEKYLKSQKALSNRNGSSK